MKLSHTSASGSSRVRQCRGSRRSEGGRGSRSIRRAVATEMPALAAATVCGAVRRSSM